MTLAEAPLPDADERRDNAAFEAVLWALSRPGEVREMPQPGVETVARALIDRECRVHAPGHAALLAELGAAPAPPEEADHALVDLTAETLAGLAPGDPLHPERGATVVAPACLGEGTRLRLTGPGVELPRELATGLPPAVWEARARLCCYPLGVELILVDGARVAAVPRSTAVEVL